jgi:hypothetical protein
VVPPMPTQGVIVDRKLPGRSLDRHAGAKKRSIRTRGSARDRRRLPSLRCRVTVERFGGFVAKQIAAGCPRRTYCGVSQVWGALLGQARRRSSRRRRQELP